MESQTWCESCREIGEFVPATTHSKNPEWSGYELCEDCAAEYDSRSSVNSCEADNK